MDTPTINVPISASFRVIDGKPVMVSAEYADVPVEAFVNLLARAFGLPPLEKMIQQQRTDYKRVLVERHTEMGTGGGEY